MSVLFVQTLFPYRMLHNLCSNHREPESTKVVLYSVHWLAYNLYNPIRLLCSWVYYDAKYITWGHKVESLQSKLTCFWSFVYCHRPLSTGKSGSSITTFQIANSGCNCNTFGSCMLPNWDGYSCKTIHLDYNHPIVYSCEYRTPVIVDILFCQFWTIRESTCS